MKKYFKISLVLLVSFFIFLNLSKISHAQPTTVDVCKPEELVYEKAMKIWDLDIRRTVDNFITSQFISLFASTAGATIDQVMGCEAYVRTELQSILANTDLTGGVGSLTGSACDASSQVNADFCDELMKDQAFDITGETLATTPIEIRSVRSSMLGMSNLLEGFARKQPLPVNLAYFWNQSISKVPFVNKALAAPTDAYKNLPMIQASYAMWQFTTKIALALITVVLLYTGIMIIMRKKVNPQLVVSVQYAIPKIIIGVLLILFSYPIGATIAAISWGLFRGAFLMMFNILLGSTAGADFPTGILYMSLIIIGIRMTGGGYFYLFILLVVAVVLIVLKIVIYFKAVLIYLKMVFSIITAPLEFVLGTVPGSEDRIKDWFLRMAKYGITIFAMGIIIPLTIIIALSLMLSYASGQGGETGGWGIVISIVAPLIVVIFGFGMGIGMEKKVDAILFGGGKKKR